MTNEQINIAVAKIDESDNLWVLKKRGLFYRPGAKGYTDVESDAWKVTEDVADRHTTPHDEPVTKHRASVKLYTESYDAIIPVIQRQPLEIRLNMTVANSISFMATPLQLCVALLKAKGLYEN